MPSLPAGEYTTRSGAKALVLATGAPGPYPLVGYVESATGYIEPMMWSAEGTFHLYGDDHAHDLILTPSATYFAGGRL